jgi:DNA-binding transcriptional MerR regulator
MNKGLYTIGEISKLKNITTKALRFYDEIGLLKPYFVDPENQYRYYHPDQLLHVDIIKAARNLEISPNELIPFFEQQDTKGLIALLEEHKEQARAKLNKLQDVITGIEHIAAGFSTYESIAVNKEVYMREIPTRHTLTLPWSELSDLENLTMRFSELEQLADESGAIATYESGYIYKIVGKATCPDKLYTTVARPTENAYYHTIPGGSYLCVNFTETNAADKQKLLNKYMAKHKIIPLDVLQAELLTELFHPEHTVWELQVRVAL